MTQPPPAPSFAPGPQPHPSASGAPFPPGPGGFAPAPGMPGPPPGYAGGPQPGFPGDSGAYGPAGGHPAFDGTPPRPAVGRTVLLAGVLQAAALVLIPLGAALPFGDSFADKALWATTTTWAVFAFLAAVVQLAPLAARLQQRPADGAWRVGAVGVAALVVFWVLIVLPGISSGQNFVLTMGTFAAALGLWLSPGRQL